MTAQRILIDGKWQSSTGKELFQAANPSTGELLPDQYPVSPREEVLRMIEAGREAARSLAHAEPELIARFLEAFAAAIEAHRDELVQVAHTETGLPVTPRLRDAELPRTTDQLRQAARAAREGSWRRPVRDAARNIHSIRAPLGGPVVVMGPNNFPFAFNSAAGGDFAAALVAQNPVIAKANTSHPGTTRIFAELALDCLQRSGLSPATLQLLYRAPKAVGFELVSHPGIGATAFTGSRAAGLQLKRAADAAGKPIYLEMSSVNPVVLLEGALRERGNDLAAEFFTSCTMGAGQFCTNPGFVVLPNSEAGNRFIAAAREKFCGAQAGVLLGAGVRDYLVEAVRILTGAGAELLCGGKPVAGPAFRFENTLLKVTAEQFLAQPAELQTEAFGPVALLVTTGGIEQAVQVIAAMEGNLTGTIYSHTGSEDDADYNRIEPVLRQKVGRLLNDKMPTGVAVSPAMNHGGPFPATGHPGFTAVGLPASIERFTALHCYDGVRASRLPAALRQ